MNLEQLRKMWHLLLVFLAVPVKGKGEDDTFTLDDNLPRNKVAIVNIPIY
jgi:hypothetical protein